MRAGVRVAADDGHARLGRAQLRPDHVHDALRGVLHVKKLHAEVRAVLAQRLHLSIRNLVGDHEPVVHAGRGHVVVDGRDVAFGMAQLAASESQAFKRLRRGDLMDQLQVDVEDRRLAFGFGDDVLLPDFFEEGAGCGFGAHSEFLRWCEKQVPAG